MSKPTVGACLTEGTARLKAAAIDQPHREARVLLAHALDVDPAVIIGYPERLILDTDGFLALIARRAEGTPTAQLVGRREFWSLPFRVTSDTLIPRPETETLVEAALAALAKRPVAAPMVLDLGTGSGCLLLALLSECPDAIGIGVDRSVAAAVVARDNAGRLGLGDRAHFLVSDWASPVAGRFDLVVSNPPYIATEEIDGLEPEVAQHEPRLALDGGADGLACYRALAAMLPDLLRPGGGVFLEVGAGQWAPVAGLLAAAGLIVSDPIRDLAGIYRCVAAQIA